MDETTDKERDTVTLELDLDEALIMCEWLFRMDDPENPEELPPFEQAALRVRWDVECMLESDLPVLASDYEERLEIATKEIGGYSQK